MRVIFFRSKGLDMTAENSVWLWQTSNATGKPCPMEKVGETSAFFLRSLKKNKGNERRKKYIIKLAVKR